MKWETARKFTAESGDSLALIAKMAVHMHAVRSIVAPALFMVTRDGRMLVGELSADILSTESTPPLDIIVNEGLMAARTHNPLEMLLCLHLVSATESLQSIFTVRHRPEGSDGLQCCLVTGETTPVSDELLQALFPNWMVEGFRAPDTAAGLALRQMGGRRRSRHEVN